MNFEIVAQIAAPLPCRTFPGEKGPYLSRYTLRELPDGGALYLHFFHRSDADRELHNHPWPGRSIILAGGYREERRLDPPVDGLTVEARLYRPGDVNILEPDTFHRVDLLDPRGRWTLFEAGPRSQSWGFWDRHSGIFTPWDEALRQRGLLPTHPSSRTAAGGPAA